MDDWVPSGSPQWWWKYVRPSYSDMIAEELWRTGPFPDPWRAGSLDDARRRGPFPEPWHVLVSDLLSAISTKEVAKNMPESEHQRALFEQADRAISDIIDDWCPTRPRRPVPRPWPGPPPWVPPAVERLVMVGHSLQEGSMREEVLRAAGELAEKALSGQSE